MGAGIAGAMAAVGLLAAPTASAAPVAGRSAANVAPRPTVVVRGLNNPRQLSLVGGIELLIAEAGKGGRTQIGTGDDATFVGRTGSVSAVVYPWLVNHSRPVRVVTGLVSAASEGGVAAVGPDGVSARQPFRSIFVQQTSAPPDVLPSGLPSRQNGAVLVARTFGALARPLANITAFEVRHDPDGQGVESDPYAVLALPRSLLVADAAGNDVLRVSRRGRVSLFHTFANITGGPCAGVSDPSPAFPGCNFVPTALARDRWGHVFVGALASEVPGAGRVVELDRTGQHVLRVWSGFTSVDGVAVARDGSLYVSQLEGAEAHPFPTPFGPTAGVLTRISPSGHRVSVDVPYAAGVAVGRGGAVYVAAFALSPSGGVGVPGHDTSGQVWRLRF
jgi:hypothetical protein